MVAAFPHRWKHRHVVVWNRLSTPSTHTIDIVLHLSKVEERYPLVKSTSHSTHGGRLPLQVLSKHVGSTITSLGIPSNRYLGLVIVSEKESDMNY